MGSGHFEMHHLREDGSPKTGAPVRVLTDTGVILNSHYAANTDDIKRLCEIARLTPDYPVDLSAWRNTDEGKVMLWSARLYWRTVNV